MSDILGALSRRRQKEEARALQAGELFFENPDLIGSDAWSDWAEKNADRFPDLVSIGGSLAERRAMDTASLADYYRNAIPGAMRDASAKGDPYGDVEGPMRDTIPGLFDMVGGIEPGSGPLAPEHWPEAQEPAARPAEAALRLPENTWGTALSGLDDRGLVSAIASLAKNDFDIAKLSLGMDPATLAALSPEAQNFAALAAENPELVSGLQSAMDVKAGLEQSEDQRLRLAETGRHNLTTEAETNRANLQREAISRSKAAKTGSTNPRTARADRRSEIDTDFRGAFATIPEKIEVTNEDEETRQAPNPKWVPATTAKGLALAAARVAEAWGPENQEVLAPMLSGEQMRQAYEMLYEKTGSREVALSRLRGYLNGLEAAAGIDDPNQLRERIQELVRTHLYVSHR